MGAAAGEAARPGYGDALRSREFRALFTAQSISIAGTSIAAVALTVLVYEQTGSAFYSSLTFALGFVPYLLGGGLLSSLVDRVRPRRLVNACDAASALIAAVMAVPGMPVAALLGLLFVLGTLSALAGGGRGALVRDTVSASAYVPARSLMKIAGQLAQIGGNVIGGALVVAVGTSGAILLNALTFLSSLALIRLLVGDHPNPAGPSSGSVLRDSLLGAQELFKQPDLARLLLLGWLVPMFSVAPEALAAPSVASRHASSAFVGWWLAAMPLGVVAGDLAGVRFLRPRLQRRLVVPVAAAGFVPYLVFALDPPMAAALVLLAASGACGMYSLGLDGLLRDAAPERLFARMMALNSAGLMTLQGVGFALAGAAAQAIGSNGAIAVAGVCGLAAVLLLQLMRRRPRQPVAFGREAGTSGGAPNLLR